MKLICGLGNPGREYEQHRHNVGFHVVALLGSRAGIRLDSEKFDGFLGQGAIGSERALLLLPQTFMNASGRALAAAARFYKIAPHDTLVVHDELDLPFGRLQLKKGGGTGGHNGLESIVEAWGETDFARLRFGIGKPQGPGAKERVAGHVLSNFRGEEVKALPDLVARSAEAVEAWAIHGLATAMNRFNTRASP